MERRNGGAGVYIQALESCRSGSFHPRHSSALSLKMQNGSDLLLTRMTDSIYMKSAFSLSWHKSLLRTEEVVLESERETTSGSVLDSGEGAEHQYLSGG